MTALVTQPIPNRIPPPRLHPRHRRFVEEYLKTGNATRSAINAGYSTTSAASIGCELLKLPKINRAIDSRLQKWEIRADNVLQEVANLAFSNVSNYWSVGEDGQPTIDFSNTSKAQLAALSEYSEDATGGTGDGERRQVLRRKIKIAPKMNALEALMDHLHLRDARIELDVSDNIAERLASARTRRTLDATPAHAQVLIDTHASDVVTNELTSGGESNGTHTEQGAESSPSTSSTTSTSLPPSPPPPSGVPYILAENLDEVGDAGIREQAGLAAGYGELGRPRLQNDVLNGKPAYRMAMEIRDTSFDLAYPPLIIEAGCVFCSSSPCSCGTGL